MVIHSKPKCLPSLKPSPIWCYLKTALILKVLINLTWGKGGREGAVLVLISNIHINVYYPSKNHKHSIEISLFTTNHISFRQAHCSELLHFCVTCLLLTIDNFEGIEAFRVARNPRWRLFGYMMTLKETVLDVSNNLKISLGRGKGGGQAQEL